MRRLRRLVFAAVTALAVAMVSGADIPALAADRVARLASAPQPLSMVRIAGNAWQFEDASLSVIPWLTPKVVGDARLAEATHLAYRVDTAWRAIADAAAARGLVIVWGVLPLPLVAGYYAGDDRIVISYAVRDASPASLAALIAHEVSHAATQACVFPFEAQACINDEVAAYAWAARVFSASSTAVTSNGLLETRWAAVVASWRRGELTTLVSEDTYYQRSYSTTQISASTS